MAKIEDKVLNRVENVKQNDFAIRNILLIVVFVVYLALMYLISLFLQLVSFQLDSLDYFAVLKKTLMVISGGKGILAFITILFLIAETALFLVFKGITVESKADYTYADNGNYGTSKFLSLDDYKKFLQITKSSVETDGIILGIDPDTKQVVSIPKNHPHNRNIFICGSQGTSKSIAFSRTMVMQCAMRGESIFLTDPKGELYRDLALFLKFMGYKVYQWNTVNRWSTDGWDMLQEVHGDEPYENIDILVNTIIANTGGPEAGDFFDNIEGLLLKAVCLYVLAKYPRKDQNFGSVYNLIQSKSSEELDTMFSELASSDEYASKLAFGAYNLFAKSPTNKGNAILGLGSRLSVFSTDVVQKMLSQPDINVEKLGREKTAIFCIASDTNSTYAVLNALLTSITFIKVMAYADRNGGKCDIPVHFILEEFVNIGVIPDYTKKLGTARSRDIGMTIIVQNMPQLENRYPKGQAEEIVGGCDFRILLGANDRETGKYFSDLVGSATIDVITNKRSATSSPFSTTTLSGVEGVSEGSGQRSLIMPEEILRMDTDQMLLIVRGQQPIKLQKYKYFYDPNALLLRMYRASDVIPDWAVTKDGTYLRNGKKITETRSQMEARIMRDPSKFVVQDSHRWGPQRSDLIKSFYRMKKKYRGEESFPNGMPIKVFDSFILGGAKESDFSFDDESKSSKTNGLIQLFTNSMDKLEKSFVKGKAERKEENPDSDSDHKNPMLDIPGTDFFNEKNVSDDSSVKAGAEQEFYRVLDESEEDDVFNFWNAKDKSTKIKKTEEQEIPLNSSSIPAEESNETMSTVPEKYAEPRQNVKYKKEHNLGKENDAVSDKAPEEKKEDSSDVGFLFP